MRARQFFISTLKEVPADAEVISHSLMLRAGMIRRLAAGIYTYMPLALRSIRKIEAIIREEMNRAGAVELLMPVVQPAELWIESGRWQKMGPEMLRLKDRHERDFIVQPTSEEVIADIVRELIGSYKQLPINFYHIQTKFRDERRPRFGVMRGREFTMKDAYSFDRDEAGARAQLSGDVRRLCAHFSAHGAEVPSGGCGYRHHRRHGQPRVSGDCRHRRRCDRVLPDVRLRRERRDGRSAAADRQRGAPAKSCARRQRPARKSARTWPSCLAFRSHAPSSRSCWRSTMRNRQLRASGWC